MRFETLLHIVGNEPVFRTGFLLAGDVSPEQVQKDLDRWVRAGKLLRLARGVYTLAPPYRKQDPHPFTVANLLREPSYVSLQAALAYYGWIPEAVFTVTSVTTHRPGRVETPLGTFVYRYMTPRRFFGYRHVEVAPGQRAWVALPEKALLDLLYLTPHSDRPEFLQTLRLDWTAVDWHRLETLARRMASPKLRRAVEAMRHVAREQG